VTLALPAHAFLEALRAEAAPPPPKRGRGGASPSWSRWRSPRSAACSRGWSGRSPATPAIGSTGRGGVAATRPRPCDATTRVAATRP